MRAVCPSAERADGSAGSGTTAGSYLMLATSACTWASTAALFGPRMAATIRNGVVSLIPAARVPLPGSSQTRTVASSATAPESVVTDSVVRPFPFGAGSSGMPDPAFRMNQAGRPPTVVVVTPAPGSPDRMFWTPMPPRWNRTTTSLGPRDQLVEHEPGFSPPWARGTGSVHTVSGVLVPT